MFACDQAVFPPFTAVENVLMTHPFERWLRAAAAQGLAQGGEAPGVSFLLLTHLLFFLGFPLKSLHGDVFRRNKGSASSQIAMDYKTQRIYKARRRGKVCLCVIFFSKCAIFTPADALCPQELDNLLPRRMNDISICGTMAFH
jgi:hypothetical protein